MNEGFSGTAYSPITMLQHNTIKTLYSITNLLMVAYRPSTIAILFYNN